jgi:DNA modification methylase
VNKLKQLPLQLKFDEISTNQDMYSGRELGTFKDSMRAPIFRWFRYPAGYSYKFVFETFNLFNITEDDWVYDPFSGTGTTLVCSKQKNINAYGVEAHSFVHWVADVKLYWEFPQQDLRKLTEQIIKKIAEYIRANAPNAIVKNIFPDLIYKCYHPVDLIELYLIREFITHWDGDYHLAQLLKLALTDTLRGAAVAQTGWPYIKPKEHPEHYPVQHAFSVFSKTLTRMVLDLESHLNQKLDSIQVNVLGDSRKQQNLNAGQVKLAITSPPYLNNYDYADRTRLETYFWEITHSWGDITEQFRNQLLVAATTQVRRSDYNVETALAKGIKDIDETVYMQLQDSIMKLSLLRLEKGGKKDYDLMTALYFNGIVEMLSETYRVLEPNGHFVLVLGDSAPYGVHIPTDDYIGKLALGLGFSDFKYHQLRKRGDKWRDNPQRHSVPLREGVVILRK